jgi:hypothetical protein
MGNHMASVMVVKKVFFPFEIEGQSMSADPWAGAVLLHLSASRPWALVADPTAPLISDQILLSGSARFCPLLWYDKPKLYGLQNSAETCRINLHCLSKDR